MPCHADNFQKVKQKTSHQKQCMHISSRKKGISPFEEEEMAVCVCGESRIGMKMDSQVKEEDIKTLEYLCYVGLFVSFLSFFLRVLPFHPVSFGFVLLCV